MKFIGSSQFVSLRASVATQLVGIGLLAVGSLVNPPFATSAQGIVWDWPSNPDPANNFCINYVQPDNRIICFDGPVDPSSGGPQLGQTVELTYLDEARGPQVLSVVTDPGLPGSVTYDTPAYASYAASRWIGYSGLVALVFGAVLTSVGVWLFLLAGRKIGTVVGALSTASTLASAVGLIPLLAVNGLPGSTATSWAMAVLWLVAALVALSTGLASLGLKEPARSLGTFGLFGSLSITLLWGISWLVYFLGHID